MGGAASFFAWMNLPCCATRGSKDFFLRGSVVVAAAAGMFSYCGSGCCSEDESEEFVLG